MNLKPQTFVFVILLSSSELKALDSDRFQPIQIQADAATVDENQGKSIYVGNVKIHQGTLEVTATKVEIYTEESQVTQIIARGEDTPGKPAHYKQQTNEERDEVSASASKITYLVREEQLHLSGNAKLKQVNDTFSGELLYYDLRKGVVNLDSGGGTNRVNMTITPPKQISE